MRVKFKGRDLGDWSGMPTLQEARLIKARLDLLPHQFRVALAQGDPDATVLHLVLLLRRNGETVDVDDVDGEYGDIIVELSDEEKAVMASATEESGKARRRKG